MNYGFVNSTEIYNIDDDTIADGPVLEATTAAACSAEHVKTKQIYFVGGFYDNSRYSTATQILDIKTRKFLPSITSQLNTGRSFPACTIYDEHNSLIVAGGSKPSWVYIDTVEVLNLNTKIWSSLEPMPCEGTMWNPNGLIFLQTDPNFYQYEPKHDRWLVVEDLPKPTGYLNERCFVFNAGIGRICDFV